MDPRLLEHYNSELQFMREMGGEFAQAYPKVASRLGLDGFECADPYVERLLEGFAFLTSRLQLKLEDEFPKFTQHLLEMIYPHYLKPLPSMLIAQCQPNLKESNLAEGFTLPKQSVLRSRVAPGEQTACQFRTSQDITLWPLKITEATYLSSPVEIMQLGVQPGAEVRAGLRIRLEVTAGLKFNELSLDRLPIYLKGSGERVMRLLEQIHARGTQFVVKSAEQAQSQKLDMGKRVSQTALSSDQISMVGFEPDQALLPYTEASFQGYRLLQEYFNFPERFQFAEFSGLNQSLRQCDGESVDLILLFEQSDDRLHQAVDASYFHLFCVPAVNLFKKTCDRIHVGGRTVEHHVVADRARPMDMEVHTIQDVKTYKAGNSDPKAFYPFYDSRASLRRDQSQAFYSVMRKPRLKSERQQRVGARSNYIGSETFISMVDIESAPIDPEVRQIAVEALCTNRDLPMHMPVGLAKGDFTLLSNAPVEKIATLSGPTPPKNSRARGETAWRLINHLHFNFRSLLHIDDALDEEDQGALQNQQQSHADQRAAKVRQLLALYAEDSEAPLRNQIEGLVAIDVEEKVKPLVKGGLPCLVRGIEIRLTFNETRFEGSGVFLLGKVMSQFFSRFASINSFTETVVVSTERGEVRHWPMSAGKRRAL